MSNHLFIFSLFVDFLLPLYFSPHLTLRSSIVPPLSDIDIPLEMGVYSCNSPQQAESTRADTPTQEIVSSSQSTPPPKRNKVGARQWGFSVWTAVNDRSDNCRLWLLIQYVDGLTGSSSVKSFTCSPSTACVSRSTWRPSVTPMRSSSCQTQNDLRPLSVPQIVPPVSCILGFPENAPFWGPSLSAGLLKSFFFFFFKFLLNWMWSKQPLTGVEKQGKLWIWYIVLVNYILPNKSPSACKGLRYNCTLSFKRQLIKLDICFLENQGFGSLLLLQLCASQRTADVDADCLLSICSSGNDLSRLGDPNFSCRVSCRSVLHD